MSVIRSPPSIRNSVPGITPLDGTPGNKRPRPESSDESVFEDQMCSKIETLISKSIEKEMGKIVQNIKESLEKTIEVSIQKSIQEGLKALEVDLSTCRNHHKELVAIKQQEKRMNEKVQQLEKQNKQLMDKLESLELYSRRNNVKILGLKESKGERCIDAVISILANANISLSLTDIATAHRVYSTTNPRPVVVQFLYPEKKRLLLSSQVAIKEKLKITVVEDIPEDLRAARNVLFPILHKAKSMFGDTNARVRGNKLIFNGKVYGLDNLDLLPPQLHPAEVFTRAKEDKMAFFTKLSPFSNHYQCKIRIEGIDFNCCEQYLMYSKAIHFNDTQQADNILKAADPVTQKRLGSKIAGFKKGLWNKKVQNVMETGLVAKFTQNPTLKGILLSTSNKILIEANKHDTYWSCGLPLFDDKVWSKEEWLGQNKLGGLLMKVRGCLK